MVNSVLPFSSDVETTSKEKGFMMSRPLQLTIERQKLSYTSFPREKFTCLIDNLIFTSSSSMEFSSSFLFNSVTTATKRRLRNLIESDPIFNNEQDIFLDRNSKYKRALMKAKRLKEHYYVNIIKTPEEKAIIMSCVGDNLPTFLHDLMFVPCIEALCTESQKEYWLPLCNKSSVPKSISSLDTRENETKSNSNRQGIIGCYAQTELGHGSNIKRLETLAIFDRGNFIMHSPTITATKYWPGTLGRTATHAMVIARLLLPLSDSSDFHHDTNINEKLVTFEGKMYLDKGIHNFIVPIRDTETHTLLPGVLAGDIGPKIGFNSMDNGFLQLDHVHIPRENMCMRFQEVDENGVYRKVGSGSEKKDMTDKIAYITMMQVRAFIILHCGSELSKATAIGIRYACIRRQGDKDKHVNKNISRSKQNISENSENVASLQSSASNKSLQNSHELEQNEMLVIDYTIQQYRLLPMLAASFAFLFAGKQLLSNIRFLTSFVSMNAKSQSPFNDGDKSKKDVGIFIKKKMQELHVALSGLKCLSSTMACAGMEDIRRSCGGHGYLLASGLPDMINTFLQQCTVEGDNYLLTQQVVAYLLKVMIQYEAEFDDDNVEEEEEREKTFNKNKVIPPINDYCSYLKTCRAAKRDTDEDQSEDLNYKGLEKEIDSTRDDLSPSSLLCLFEDRVYLSLKKLKTNLQEMILPSGDLIDSDDSDTNDPSVSPQKEDKNMIDLDLDLVEDDVQKKSNINNFLCLLKQGQTEFEAWNISLLEVYRLSQAHSKVMILRAFLDGITDIENIENQNLDQNQTCFPDERNSCSKVLHDLFLLLALYWIDEDGKDFFELGLISNNNNNILSSRTKEEKHIKGLENVIHENKTLSLTAVRRAMTTLSSDCIRPYCLALVDAFDWSDMQLHHSALGSYDGNVYERLIKRSKDEPLNQFEPITKLFSNEKVDQKAFTHSNL